MFDRLARVCVGKNVANHITSHQRSRTIVTIVELPPAHRQWRAQAAAVCADTSQHPTHREMGLALFTRVTSTAWVLTVPRIVLRRLVHASKRSLSTLGADTHLETLLLLLAPAFLTSHRLRTSVFSLRGELFIELFRHVYLLPNHDDVRCYVAFLTSLMPQHKYIARRNIHVASTDDQSSTPFSGVLFCEPSLLNQARSGTCLQGAHNLPQTTVLLYIHGGGFCTGTPTMAAPMFERMIAAFAARSQDPHRRLAVFSLEYCLAPEHPFPHALQQAVHAYLWLLQQGYHSVVIGMHAQRTVSALYDDHSRWGFGGWQPRAFNPAPAAGRLRRRRAHASWRAVAIALGRPHLHTPS